MLIAIDARMILPQMTGVGRYLLGLAGGLRSLPGPERYELWLQSGLADDHPAWALAAENLRLRRLPIRHMDVRQNWVLPRELRRSRPDLLHYPHFDLPLTVTAPIVATIHDLKYLSHPRFFPQMSAAKRLAMRWMMVSTVRRARRVITDSEFTRQDLAKRLKAPLEKLCAIPLGVDAQYHVEIPETEVQAVRQRYGLGDNNILFVGERRPHKNIIGLLHAFAYLQKLSARPYQLVIAGKPYADYQEPERLAESLGLGGSVRFLDYVPDADLPALYRGAAAFVLLSYYEGFGLPIIEAMACGTPVVAANRTSLPEVCGEAALLVDPDAPKEAAQALLKALPGGAQREALIAGGLERARQFTWQACAERTRLVYHDTLQ
jgi:glycosyltransferase involved in cell wall biosynthesis